MNWTFVCIAIGFFMVGEGIVVLVYKRAMKALTNPHAVRPDEFRSSSIVMIIVALFLFGASAAFFAGTAREYALGRPLAFADLKENQTYVVFEVVKLHEVIFLRKEGSAIDFCVKVDFEGISKFKGNDRFIFQNGEPVFLK